LVGAATAGNRIQVTATLDTAKHNISGWVTVSWPLLTESVEDIRFRLYANVRRGESVANSVISDSAFTSVDSLAVNGLDLLRTCILKGTDLTVPLARASAAGESLTVRLHFNTQVAALTAGIDRLFHSGGSYLLDGWFPMPAPRRDGQWMQIEYSSSLVELVADFFDFDVQFTAPKDIATIGAGLVSADTIGEQITHHFSLPSAHDFALYLTRELVAKRFEQGPVTISVYTSEHAAYTADRIADVCGQTLDIMGKMVAPYPFPELHVVVSDLGFIGGIELPRMIICTEPMSARFSGARDIVTIHEVVHQWFYGIVNSNQANTPFLDEAVTDYFTERVSRSLYDESSFLSWWGWTLDYSGLQRLQGLRAFDRLPITLPAAQYYSPGTYSATVYNKGAVILRTMFAQMRPGDENDFWCRYFERYRFAVPTLADFIGLASEYPPFVGTTIVSELLHSTKSVDYVVEQISNEPLKDQGAQKDSLTDTAPPPGNVRSTINYAMYNPIDLPVTLRLSFTDGSHRDTLLAPREGQAKLTITGDKPLVSAVLDPEYRFGLDRDLLNNSLSLTSNSSSLRLFSGITFLVESLFSYLWGM